MNRDFLFSEEEINQTIWKNAPNFSKFSQSLLRWRTRSSMRSWRISLLMMTKDGFSVCTRLLNLPIIWATIHQMCRFKSSCFLFYLWILPLCFCLEKYYTQCLLSHIEKSFRHVQIVISMGHFFSKLARDSIITRAWGNLFSREPHSAFWLSRPRLAWATVSIRPICFFLNRVLHEPRCPRER